MSRHKITATRSGSHPTMGDWDAEYEITFKYRPGAAPITHPADNADPGYPAEVEAVDVKPEIGSLDAREHADTLEWAQLWLDDNYDKTLEIVASDNEAAREFQAELRAER